MEFSEVIAKRHSVRKFTSKVPDREILDRMIEEASTAPSSKNSKSSGFLVIEDRDTLDAISEMRQLGSSFIKGSTAAIVVLGDTEKSDLWAENCSISATFLMLSAVNEGLGSCWVHVHERPRSKDGSIPGTSEDYLRDLLGVKENMGILCVIALGYPDE